MMSLLIIIPPYWWDFFYAIIHKKIGQFMTGLRNFYDLIHERGNCDKNLLLGNGFSVAFSNAFCYDSILKESSFCNSNLFRDTPDYEKVMKDLHFKRDVYQQACDDYCTASIFEDWCDELKWDLVNIITDIQSRVKPNKREKHNTFLFLSNFSNIFTLNYDLLLYWVINYAVKLYRQNKYEYYSIVRTDKFYPRDGFDTKYNEDDCIWYQDKWIQNIFYLHGGLHLFCDEQNIYKLKNNSVNNLSIADKTKYWLNKGVSPIVIIEGNSDDKLSRINNCNYLEYCYQKWNQICGVVFIYGHSLDENDKHIFDAINANLNIKVVYISIFDPIKNEATIRQRANELFKERINDKSLIVDFYNAQSVSLW